jgi:hypothetical protein
MPSILGQIGVAWSIVGLALLLCSPILRLLPIALEPVFGGHLVGGQWLAFILFVLFNIYAEGVRGFQKAFSPRVAARMLHLKKHPTLIHVLLAPAFCMGLLHATRRRLAVSWTLLVLIVVLVRWVGSLVQPWRGIIDAGVVAGLLYGVCATAVCVWRSLRGKASHVDPELPRPRQPEPIQAKP